MVYYESAALCIESATTLQAKIQTINTIITALEGAVLKAVGTADIEEYSLNDGQTVIKTVYRSTKEVIDSIGNLEFIKQRYVNQLNGRVTRLMDSKSLNGRR